MAERKITLSGQQLAQLYDSARAAVESLSSQRDNTVMRLREIEMTLAAVEAAEKAGNDSQMMVSLGAGVIMGAKTANNKKFWLTLPGNILLENSGEELRKELGKRKAAMEKGREGLDKELEKAVNNFNNWSNILNESVHAARSQRGEARPKEAE